MLSVNRFRIIITNSENSKPASTSTGMSNPQRMPSRLNEPLDAGSVTLAASPGTSSHPFRTTPKRQKSCPAGHAGSIDAEGLFEFEATDEFHSGTGSEIEESDADEAAREDGVKIPRRAAASNPIAKSLPMNIPAFLSLRNRVLDEEDEEPRIESTADIAASMKALARSVHGEPVFGELPKPRYTYI